MTPDQQREAAIASARLAKAQRIARVLLAHGATGAEVGLLPASSRRTVEALAAVHTSSDATWAMAADLVSAHRALAGRLPADPFSVLEAS